MTMEHALESYARRKDAEAFRILVDRYQGLVYSAASRVLGRREDIEDVTQQTFLKLALQAGKVRANVGGWLHATAVNGAMDLVRRDATRRRHEGRVVVKADNGEEEWADVSAVIDEEITKLADEEQALIVAHFLEGQTHREIAGRMRVNQSTVTRRMESAVESLRRALATRGFAEGAGAGAALAALPKATVPALVTEELVKVGLAGAGGKAATGIGLWMVIGAVVGALALVAADVMAASHWSTKLPVAAAAPAATQPMSEEAALDALKKEGYALGDNEDLKRILPPFPPARDAYVDAAYSYTRGGANVHSLPFIYNDGRLSGTGFSYPPMNLHAVIDNVLAINWYHVENLQAISWKEMEADWVFRGDHSADQHMDESLKAFAKILSEDTGKTVTFEHAKRKRLCLVLTGAVHRTPELPNHFHPVVVCTGKPTPEEMTRWQEHMPRGAKYGLQFVQTGQCFDTPCFGEPFGDVFYVTSDAQIHEDDPGYREKLAEIVENLKGQVGGTWMIEERELDVWRAQVK